MAAVSPGAMPPLLLAAATFLVCIALTAWLWQAASAEAARALQAAFDFQVRQTVRRVEQRLGSYQQALRSTAAFLLGTADLGRDDFRYFIDASRIEQNYPGVQGILIAPLVPRARLERHLQQMRQDGWSDYSVHPAGTRESYAPVTHIAPDSAPNWQVPGFDLLSSPQRRLALERARDTGEAAITSKVLLDQKTGGQAQSGVVMYLPVFQRGLPTTTVAQRRVALVAWVGARFRLDDLMAGLLEAPDGDIALSIFDGATTASPELLFASPGSAAAPGAGVAATGLQASHRMRVGGRAWMLELQAAPGRGLHRNIDKPTLIGGAGLAASVVLALLVWLLATGRRRAMALASTITDRLQESEFRWKYALEGAGDGVWDWNTKTGEVLYSKRWKAMLGYAEGEIRNTLAESARLLCPQDRRLVMAAVRAYLGSRDQAFTCEYRMLCRDGSWKWMLARGMAVSRDTDGTILRTIGTHADITQRKQQEDALRRSNDSLLAQQQRIRMIFENTHDAFVALDTDGRITDWNRKAEATFGWRVDEVVGRDLAELIIPEHLRAAHNAGFRHFAATGQARLIRQVVEVEAVHRCGALIALELAVAGFPQPGGYAVSAFIRDISERKAAERAETERSRALEETREALHHARKLEAVGKLTGGVAHDFNNVLQVIYGNVQLVQASANLDDVQKKRLAGMMHAVERGAKLSSQLLAFARRQPLEPVVLDLARLLTNMDDLMQRAVGATVDIQTAIAADLWHVAVDPGQLENVLLNLVINARDAMPDGGVLTLALANGVIDTASHAAWADAVAGDYVCLSVTDTGVGMTRAVREQAFEPFFTTKAPGAGTGLGLSMAYGFIKQSGGHIDIASEPGQGATIRIFLPRSLQQATPTVAPAASVEAGGDESILLVEDDLEVQAAVASMLGELGYRVVTADSGAAALAVIDAGAAIDLLFTDVVMPGPVSSLELARLARQRIPGIAVLFTSGYTRDALVSGGRLDTGVHLLSKPYGRDRLAAKVRAVLSQPG